MITSALLFVVPCTLILTLDSTSIGIEDIFPLFVLFFSSLMLVRIQLSGKEKVISICFWIFSYAFFGICPLLQFINGDGFVWNHQRYPFDVIGKAYMCIIASLVSFSIGVLKAEKVKKEKAVIYIYKIFKRQLDEFRIKIFLVIYMIISIIMVYKSGGVSELFVSRMDHSNYIYNIVGNGDMMLMLSGIWDSLLHIPSAAIFICIIAYRKFDAHKNKILIKAMVVMSGVIALIINNPISTARYWCGMVYLSSILILHQWKKRNSSFVFINSLVLIILVVFPFADTYRMSVNENIHQKYQGKSLVNILISKPDFDSAQQSFNSIEYVNRNGFSYGKQLLGSVFVLVPRSIWNSKPKMSSAIIADFEGYSFTNLSLPLCSELYLDGGIIFVLIMFYLYGKFVSKLEALYEESKQKKDSLYVLVVVPMWAMYQFIFLRGSLMPNIVHIIPLIICTIICTKGGHYEDSLSNAN
jgi:hypothetical protein